MFRRLAQRGILFMLERPHEKSVGAAQTIEITGQIIPLADVITEWLKVKNTRRVIISTKQGKFFDAADLTPDQLVDALKVADQISVIDPDAVSKIAPPLFS